MLTEEAVTEYANRAGVDVHPFDDLGWLLIAGDPAWLPPISLTEWEGNVLLNVLPVVTVGSTTARPSVAERLLRLNAERHLIKYALEEEWQVLLWTAYPAKEFTYELFAAGLAAMCDALENDISELQKLANS
jgi:hypothetical protein